MDSYRSLVAWQVARKLSRHVLTITDSLYHPRSRALFDQIRRAAISVEANIVEGYALGTKPQFRRHLRIAFASAAEAECMIDLAGEVGYLPKKEVQTLTVISGRALKLTLGLIVAG